MTPEQAEKRYYELYNGFMDARLADYARPIVQKQIREQTWTALVREIEADAERRMAERLLAAGALQDRSGLSETITEAKHGS